MADRVLEKGGMRSNRTNGDIDLVTIWVGDSYGFGRTCGIVSGTLS